MASTRYAHQSFEIHQDAQAYDSAPLPTSKRSSAAKLNKPVRTLNSRRNILFHPPEQSHRKPSPLKSSLQYSSSPLSSSPSRRAFNKFNMVSMPPPHPNFHLMTDSIEKRTTSQNALFTTFMVSSGPEDKENMYNPSNYNILSTKADFPIDANYGVKSAGKRTLLDAAPIPESSRPSKKSKGSSGEIIIIPEHDHFPALHDDGKKPGHSYAQLIGMAILRTPARRLTLAQIYKWISDTYSFFNPNDAGWQNSIRHNLSLNKAFVKQERPKDDPGKGNYWAIAPGTEQQFLKGKQSGKGVGPLGEMSSLKEEVAPELPPPCSAPESAVRNPDPDMSSDATIPASDAFVPEEEPAEPEDEEKEEEEEGELVPPPPPTNDFLATSSPPPPTMHSSPPISRHSHRDDTPPSVLYFPTSSVPRQRGKVASTGDSGYLSGLSSSVQRPSSTSREAPKSRFPDFKKSRGRAEEEIARLRGSSIDSPTKSVSTRPSRTLNFSSQSRHDSSPVRPSDSSLMLPPLTPAVKLKAPAQAPPSISPNANLRKHRQCVQELLDLPFPEMSTLDDNESVPWSPAFNMESPAFKGDEYAFHGSELKGGGGHGLGVYEVGASTDDCNLRALQSTTPTEKRSKSSQEDSGRSKSRGVLGDVTNTRQSMGNPFKSTPKLSPSPNFAGNADLESPTKSRGFMNQQSPSQSMVAAAPYDDTKGSGPSKSSLFSHAFMDMGFDTGAPGFDNWGEENFLVGDFDNATTAAEDDKESLDSEGGLDLLGGFQKIGSGRTGAVSSAVSSFGAVTANVVGNGRLGLMKSFAGRY